MCLTRQDEFLRAVLARLRADQSSVVISMIEDRLTKLKPVIYENHDLSSGLSWDGHIIAGDAESIKAVKLALHHQDNVPRYVAHIRRCEKRYNELMKATETNDA